MTSEVPQIHKPHIVSVFHVLLLSFIVKPFVMFDLNKVQPKA